MRASHATLDQLTSFALELAAAARRETLSRWTEHCVADDKGRDAFDPVTEADREAELAMRALIRFRYPNHGITGEEWPDDFAAGDLTWSLDPIDGTRSFVCRLPTWVTLIALLKDGLPVLGIIDCPCLDETYIGGDQAWMMLQGQRTSLHTSGCSALKEARFSTTDPFLFDDAKTLDRILRSVRHGCLGQLISSPARAATSLSKWTSW